MMSLPLASMPRVNQLSPISRYDSGFCKIVRYTISGYFIIANLVLVKINSDVLCVSQA